MSERNAIRNETGLRRVAGPSAGGFGGAVVGGLAGAGLGLLAVVLFQDPIAGDALDLSPYLTFAVVVAFAAVCGAVFGAAAGAGASPGVVVAIVAVVTLVGVMTAGSFAAEDGARPKPAMVAIALLRRRR